MNPLVLLLAAFLGALLFGAGVSVGILLGHRGPIGEVRRQEVKPTRLPAPPPDPMAGMVTPPPGFRAPEPTHRFVSPTPMPLTEDAPPPPPSPRRGAGSFAYGARSPEESAAMFEEMQDALRRKELGGPFDDAYGA